MVFKHDGLAAGVRPGDDDQVVRIAERDCERHDVAFGGALQQQRVARFAQPQRPVVDERGTV